MYTSPKHQHHTPISTRPSLDSPYIAEFEQFLSAVQKRLSYRVLRTLGGCGEVQEATTVLASSLRARTHDTPHEGASSDLKLALCERRVDPSSSLWNVEAVPRARLHHCLLCEGFE